MSWRTGRAGLAKLLVRRSTSPLRSESVKGATQEREVTLVFESASTHAMIAVKDLGRAKEFYSGMLGLTASDERHGSGIRYETQGGSWFLVYRSEFAGTARSTCMRFEVEDVESAVRQLRARGIVFEEYDLPDVKTVDGIAKHQSGARGAWFKDPDGNVLQIGQYGK
jgi:catechol 2,3-dioxygenase-like lactoylglutathione lyase family enzyme